MPAVPIHSRLKAENGTEYKMYEVNTAFTYPFHGVKVNNSRSTCTRTLFGLTFNNDRRTMDDDWVSVTHIENGPVLPLSRYDNLWDGLYEWPGQANREALENCYKRIYNDQG